MGERNRRILIIDNNESIHRDFRAILEYDAANTPHLDELKADIYEFKSDLRADYAMLELAIRSNSKAVKEVKEEVVINRKAIRENRGAIEKNREAIEKIDKKLVNCNLKLTN